MNAVFADAGYWIALFNPRDRLHDIATAVSQTIRTYANLVHGGRFLIFNPLNPPYQGDL